MNFLNVLRCGLTRRFSIICTVRRLIPKVSANLTCVNKFARRNPNHSRRYLFRNFSSLLVIFGLGIYSSHCL
jgi:hypothetical protein